MIKDFRNDKSAHQSKTYIDGSTDKHELDNLVDEHKKKLRELKQKHKVDLDIKENLVRSLKLKIEQQQEIIEDLRDDHINDKNANMPMQIEQQTILEKQQKKDKTKIKKYD